MFTNILINWFWFRLLKEERCSGNISHQLIFELLACWMRSNIYKRPFIGYRFLHAALT